MVDSGAMTPLLLDILAGLVRLGLGALSGWLIAHQVITDEQGRQLVSQGATELVAFLVAAVPVVWTVVSKVRARVILNTALCAPAGASLEQVKRAVDQGFGESVKTRV